MKNNGEQLEGLRQFVAARFRIVPHRAGALARPQAFSREVVRRHGRMPATDTLGFLRSLFGQGQTIGELPGYRSDLIFREPGKIFRQSFYNWFVNSVLSLTVNRLEQRFGIWPSQTHAPQTILNLEHKSSLTAQTYRQSPGHEVFLRLTAPNAGTEPRSGVAVTRVIERSLRTPREVYVKDAGRPGAQVFHLPSIQKEQAGREQSAASIGTQVFHPPSIQKTLRDALGTYFINTLREFEGRARAASVDATSARFETVTRVAGATREFVIHVLNRLTVPPLSSRAAAMKAGEVYVVTPAGGSAAASSKATAGGVSGSTAEFVTRSPGVSPDAAMPMLETVTRVAGATREFVIHVLNQLTVPPLSSRAAAMKAGEVYVVTPAGGSAAASSKATAGGVSGSTAEFVTRSPGVSPDAAMPMPVTLHRVRPAGLLTREESRGWRGSGGVFSQTTVMPVRLADWFERQPGAGLSFIKPSAELSFVKPGAGHSFVKVGGGLSFVKVEPARVGPTVSVVLKTGGVGASWKLDEDEDTPAPPLNRDLAARTMLAARTIRTYQPATEGRREGPGGGVFTFLRREEQLRPPAQSYTFAQTFHPAPVEAPAVMRAREKEVEEMVSKQVETAMKSRSPIDSLSRSDYSRIADHVYSALARRLLIDKERSGLHR
jgi:hypothetical protein